MSDELHVLSHAHDEELIISKGATMLEKSEVEMECAEGDLKVPGMEISLVGCDDAPADMPILAMEVLDEDHKVGGTGSISAVIESPQEDSPINRTFLSLMSPKDASSFAAAANSRINSSVIEMLASSRVSGSPLTSDDEFTLDDYRKEPKNLRRSQSRSRSCSPTASHHLDGNRQRTRFASDAPFSRDSDAEEDDADEPDDDQVSGKLGFRFCRES